jgi:hypothetical protein
VGVFTHFFKRESELLFVWFGEQEIREKKRREKKEEKERGTEKKKRLSLFTQTRTNRYLLSSLNSLHLIFSLH